MTQEPNDPAMPHVVPVKPAAKAAGQSPEQRTHTQRQAEAAQMFWVSTLYTYET